MQHFVVDAVSPQHPQVSRSSTVAIDCCMIATQAAFCALLLFGHQITVISACSGHGFKMSNAVGEHAASLAFGEPADPGLPSDIPTWLSSSEPCVLVCAQRRVERPSTLTGFAPIGCLKGRQRAGRAEPNQTSRMQLDYFHALCAHSPPTPTTPQHSGRLGHDIVSCAANICVTNSPGS